MECERLGRWRIKNGVMEGSEESLVWELQAWEMRCPENQAGLRNFSTLSKFPTNSFQYLPSLGF